jgi:hypothetical protein
MMNTELKMVKRGPWLGPRGREREKERERRKSKNLKFSTCFC